MRGQMIPFVALMSLVIIGMVGLGLDASAAYGHERDDHNAADAAALRGTQYLWSHPSSDFDALSRRTGTVAAVQDVGTRNGVSIKSTDVTPVDGKGTPVNDWSLAFGVKVTAHTDHKTFLLKAVGLSSVSVTASATAVTQFPALYGGVPLTLNNVQPHLEGGNSWWTQSVSQPPMRDGFTCFMITGGMKDPNTSRINPPTCERNFGTLMPPECAPLTGQARRDCVIQAFLNGSKAPIEWPNKVYDASDIDALTELTRDAIKCRLGSPAPLVTPPCPANGMAQVSDPSKFVAGNPRVVNVIVTTGEFGNPKITTQVPQQMLLVSVGQVPFWFGPNDPVVAQYSAQWPDAVVVRFPRDGEALPASAFGSGGTPPSYGDGSISDSVHAIKLIG
jgi:hypothetical protein